MRRLRPPVRVAALLVAGAAALAACSPAGGSAEPTWEPSPAQVHGGEGGGGGVSPIIPVPEPTTGGGGGPSGTGTGAPAPGRPSSSGGKAIDPFVVATHLRSPVGLSLLPDNTALVGERTTGRIVRVQPVAGRPVSTVRTLAGLDTSGDGGLLDLAVSPSYTEDNLIYAYVTTRTDNRVVAFTLHGPVTTVLTRIPKGRSGNAGRILFDPDGTLYVGTGDAGHPALAQNPTSLAGKVLRVDPIGDVPRDNPRPGSPVWTSGHHGATGLCTADGTLFEVENGGGTASDEVNRLDPGNDYGYPANGPGGELPVRAIPPADPSPGGCAVLQGRLWVTSLDGQALLSAPLSGPAGSPTVGAFAAVLRKKYGRLRTVVAAADGALWMTTSNRDGHGHPVAADERVIRYLPASSDADSPA